MKKYLWSILSLPFLLVIILTSCRSAWQLVNNNLAEIYIFDDAFSDARLNVAHINDTLSFAGFGLPQTSMLFSRATPSDSFYCRVGIKLVAITSDAHEITDSSSYSYPVLKDSLELPVLSFSLPLKLSRDFKGMVFLLLKAPPMKREKMFVCEVDKSNPASLNWFDYHQGSGKLVISRHKADPGKYNIVIFKDTALLPPPPFSMENYREHPGITSRSLHLNTSGMEIEFMQGETYWQIQQENGNKSDFVYIPCGNYPYVRNTREMLNPLRFLTSQKEFQKIENDSNVQRAVEKFWIDVAGTQERARKVISNYYKGVEIANRLFGDFRPGWKTDRGMIYVVMGPPRVMYRSADREMWIYGEERSLYSVTFEFEKKNNIYVLQRNPGSKENWYQAVEMWRQ